MPATARITICIISYRAPDALRRCLLALDASNPREDVRVVVADNSTDPNIHEMIRREFATVELIRNETNLFFEAYRRPFECAESPYFLILNQDVEMSLDALDGLLSYMDAHLDIGALGPRSVHLDGSTELVARPAPSFGELLLTYTVLRAFRRMCGSAEPDASWLGDEPKDVGVMQDSCLLVRREAVAGALYDWRLRLYFTEDYLCTNIRASGYRVVYYPLVSILHVGQHSTSRASPMAMRWLYYRDMFIYSSTQFGWLRTALLLIPAALAYLGWRFIRTRGAGSRQRDR